MITVPIITYLLAPAELGKYFYILSLTSIMVPMFILNLADGPVLHFVQENDILKIKRMYYTVQNTTIISLFFFNVVLLLISHFIDLKFSDYIGYVILIILCQSIFKITSYLLVVYQKTDILIRYSFTKEIISFVIGILLLIAGIGIRGLMVGIILTDVVAGMLIGLKIYKEIGYEPIIDTKYLVKFLKISIPLLPVFFFSWIMLALDTFLLMYLQGAYSVGIYNIAYSLSSIILTVTFALNFFWFPVSAKMWGESREKYKKLFKVLFSVASVLLLCMVVLFELNAEFILKFLVKNTEYYAAKPIIGIISFAMAMRVLITLLTAPLYSNKNSFMIFLTNFVGAFVTVILDILLIPKYGISGAAITTAISYFL
ncbi:polysaccharide biosynthesis C-terminal domain-containing protein, partial [Candidatus Desantisbacteria bacterium]|nr:polysaccharide biosynthesis C-terminal domain-containing protein [Candidatus Desantisbacteria bacterium]